MTVRLARGEDIPAVAALERAVFPEGAAEDLLRRMLADGRHVLLLAEEDGEMLGYAWYEFVRDEGDVGNLAVKPRHRRRGAGRALAEAM
ncbi:MAG: GNAT family N-acetyltransferase, partial [Oscillospiraceae bacterium]|nr:GNAT family N-acetyltransferase [Oscillospiraceae bacterium]